VGNLSAGGSGKTPHTEYLAGLLGSRFRIAILSRGYKRKSHGFKIASADSTVADVGDEPIQMCRKFPDIIVAVDRNRKHGIDSILNSRPETEVIILDDGFQHRRIKPGLSIILSDFHQLFTDDHLLPYGNLRESIKNIKRADIIIITKSPSDMSADQQKRIYEEVIKVPHQKLFFTTVSYDAPEPLFGEINWEHELPASLNYEESGIVLVTGIVNPQPLKEYLSRYNCGIIHLRFSDHHQYTSGDIEKIRSAWNSLKTKRRFVFTTGKDAAGLREFVNIAEPLRSAFFYIPIRIDFLNNAGDEFDNIITEYARKNN
jgi:tetraacyldisaccharide 4'-kinase